MDSFICCLAFGAALAGLAAHRDIQSIDTAANRGTELVIGLAAALPPVAEA